AQEQQGLALGPQRAALEPDGQNPQKRRMGDEGHGPGLTGHRSRAFFAGKGPSIGPKRRQIGRSQEPFQDEGQEFHGTSKDRNSAGSELRRGWTAAGGRWKGEFFEVEAFSLAAMLLRGPSFVVGSGRSGPAGAGRS